MRDLDETRRLLIAARASGGAVSETVAATIANALAHHSRLFTHEEAGRLIGALVTGIGHGEQIERALRAIDAAEQRVITTNCAPRRRARADLRGGPDRMLTPR